MESLFGRRSRRSKSRRDSGGFFHFVGELFEGLFSIFD
jgi:hypothetical protein